MRTHQPILNEELALAAVAVIHRNELGARSRQAALRNADHGIYTGKPVNGYLKVPGSMVHRVDEVKRGKIARIWQLAGKEEWPLRKLLRECHEIGLTSVSGNRMSLNSLHLMLTNPFYAGKVRASDGLADGQHEAVVSRTAFETVQRTRRKRKCRI